MSGRAAPLPWPEEEEDVAKGGVTVDIGTGSSEDMIPDLDAVSKEELYGLVLNLKVQLRQCVEEKERAERDFRAKERRILDLHHVWNNQLREWAKDCGNGSAPMPSKMAELEACLDAPGHRPAEAPQWLWDTESPQSPTRLFADLLGPSDVSTNIFSSSTNAVSDRKWAPFDGKQERALTSEAHRSPARVDVKKSKLASDTKDHAAEWHPLQANSSLLDDDDDDGDDYVVESNAPPEAGSKPPDKDNDNDKAQEGHKDSHPRPVPQKTSKLARLFGSPSEATNKTTARKFYKQTAKLRAFLTHCQSDLQNEQAEQARFRSNFDVELRALRQWRVRGLIPQHRSIGILINARCRLKQRQIANVMQLTLVHLMEVEKVHEQLVAAPPDEKPADAVHNTPLWDPAKADVPENAILSKAIKAVDKEISVQKKAYARQLAPVRSLSTKDSRQAVLLQVMAATTTLEQLPGYHHIDDELQRTFERTFLDSRGPEGKAIAKFLGNQIKELRSRHDEGGWDDCDAAVANVVLSAGGDKESVAEFLISWACGVSSFIVQLAEELVVYYEIPEDAEDDGEGTRLAVFLYLARAVYPLLSKTTSAWHHNASTPEMDCKFRRQQIALHKEGPSAFGVNDVFVPGEGVNMAYSKAVGLLEDAGYALLPVEALLAIKLAAMAIQEEAAQHAAASGISALAADDVFPIYAWCVARAFLPHPHANVEFIRDFFGGDCEGELFYWLAMFEASVELVTSTEVGAGGTT